MLPSAAELVARFLRANDYTQTLKSFIEEADLPTDIGINLEDATTIETILEEKKTFDLSINFEKLGVDEESQGWTVKAPSRPNIVRSLPNLSNILNVSVFKLSLPSIPELRPYIAITTADRQLHLLDPSAEALNLVQSFPNSHDSPILDVVAIRSCYLLVASMSGRLILYDTVHSKPIDECKHHSKYLVKIAIWDNVSSILVATAGWDAKIFLHKLEIGGESPSQLGQPIAKLELPSIPETIVSILSDEGNPILLVARRDSTFLHYYSLPTDSSPGFTFIGRQNLAPHSSTWVTFSPADVQISPTDPLLAAVVTSSTPYMKLLILRLLLPPKQGFAQSGDPILGPTELDAQAPQRAAVVAAKNGRPQFPTNDFATSANANDELIEEAAILVNVSTWAPQTNFSTPRVVWRPDGTGVFVSSDDGVIRGIETKTGKLVASLRAHEVGSKLRCLWAGYICVNDSDGDQNEYLISGGFDQRVILWSPE